MTDLVSMPPDPCLLLQEWLELAERDSGMANHNTMMLATVGTDGRPSVRAVLHKGFDAGTGRLSFYTNYKSRKARDIEANPDVAVVMHWDALKRQVRIEGRAEPSPAGDSDAYFASRPRTHQLGAWASDQSEALEGPELLVLRMLQAANHFMDRDVERPPYWGGYAVIPRAMEFWVEAPGRMHYRLRYEREDESGEWQLQWLYP